MKTPEDEAFEDIERRQSGGFPAKRAMAADRFIAAEERKVGERYGYVPKLHPSEWMDESAQEPVARVLQIIKELRPAIKPMEGMGKGKTTAEWFDILVKEIERIQPAQEPVEEWFGQSNIESLYNACQHRGYCKQLKAQQPLPAQPAQEPVAWISPKGNIHFYPYPHRDSMPLYTTPPPRPWVGLTDEEIDKKYWAMPRINKPQPTQLEFARAIEQALKEKNNG